MRKKKILILDDDTTFRRHHIAKLRNVLGFDKSFDLEEITPDKFQNILGVLENRRGQARKAELREFSDVCSLDGADILIVDYDLLSLASAGVMTGENVAYLARCFSRCGFILGLNQFGVNAFDLTLKGHPESFADLNIGSEQLNNPGLWAEPWRGFRPWGWPLIGRSLDQLERRATELQNRMGDRVLEFLQIAEPVANLVPRPAAEFISRSKTVNETTFEEFVLDSGNGLRGRRDRTSQECMVRIAAARIHKWLERLVLPGQDILVDAPHLVSRYPSLLRGREAESASFDRTASLKSVDRLGIDHQKIEGHRFSRTDWLSRPAWFWPGLTALQTIDEVREPWKSSQPDLVFCEDISRFRLRRQCTEFVADLSSPFVRRYVARLERIDYRPAVRLSL
jgi:hypothetical protein